MKTLRERLENVTIDYTTSSKGRCSDDPDLTSDVIRAIYGFAKDNKMANLMNFIRNEEMKHIKDL